MTNTQRQARGAFARNSALSVSIVFAALSALAANSYVVPWYANPAATNVAYDAALVNDPADAAIAAKITAAWTTVSGASALAGKTALVKTMGDTTYFRPKFYVLCTDGDVIEFTMARDLSSSVWTNTLTASKLATAAGAIGAATDLQVSDDGRLAFLNYGGTWKALGYAAPTWRVITDSASCPCPDKHPVMVDSTGTYVLHFTRKRSWGSTTVQTKWSYNPLSIGTTLTVGGVVAAYDDDLTGATPSTVSGNGFCPSGSIGEYLDLSAGVVTWQGHSSSSTYNIEENWQYALGVPSGGRTPRVIVHSPNITSINKIMGGWEGGYEEVILDSAAIPAGKEARPDQNDDGFAPSVKRLVLNVPNLTPNAYAGFPSSSSTTEPIASESRWEDFSFSGVTDFAGMSFGNFDCGGTLSLPSVVKVGYGAFKFVSSAHENTTPVEVLISPENKTVTNIVNQAFSGQANIWRVVIGGHEAGVTFSGGNANPYHFNGVSGLREVEFTGGLPLFAADCTGNEVFTSSQATRTFAFIVPREQKWLNFIEGKYRPATDAEIASYTAANPGRYVPFGVVADKSLFHSHNEQYIAFADSFGKGAPIPFSLCYDETRGSVAVAVVEGNPADASGRYEKGTVLRLAAASRAGSDGVFARWYGDIGTNDATSATITVTVKENFFVAARFKHPWTIVDFDSDTKTAKATDGNFRINLSDVSLSKHTFTLGSGTVSPYGLFEVTYTDNGDNTVTTNMLAGSSTLDLGGEFRMGGDSTPFVATAFANVNYLASYPVAYRDRLLCFFSPGTITSEMKKALFNNSSKNLSVCFETVVLDEPSMPGKLKNSTFAGTSRKARNIVLMLPSITEIEEKALWDSEPVNDLSTWDLSSVATLSPIGLTTQWMNSNEYSYQYGRKAFDCDGDLSLPALRSVDAGVWTKSGVEYRAVSLSPMPYVTGLTLGGKTASDTVTSLCDGAFAGNSAMTNLVIYADAGITVGTDIFADFAGGRIGYTPVTYPGHTPERMTIAGAAPNADIFANLLAGVGAGDAPVRITVPKCTSSWMTRPYIDYRPTAAEKALAGEDAANVFGVYRAGFVKAVFIGRKPWKGYIITIR